MSADYVTTVAEAVMRDLDCADVFGHRDELTDSLRRHLTPNKRSGAEPSGVSGNRSADAPPPTSSDGGSPETERAMSNVDSPDRSHLFEPVVSRGPREVLTVALMRGPGRYSPSGSQALAERLLLALEDSGYVIGEARP